MPLFSCLRPKSGPKSGTDCYVAPVNAEANPKAGLQSQRTVNERFLALLHALSSLEAGGLPALVDACRATCEHLGADQVSICHLGGDRTATVVACAGLEGDAALGRRQVVRVYDSDCSIPLSVADAVLRCREANPTMPVIFLEASPGRGGGGGTAYSQWDMSANSFSVRSPSRRPDLPEQWRQLHSEYGCRQFAGATMVASGEVVGVLSLAAKGLTRPASWTPEAITTVATLLAGPLRAAHVVADALARLYAASTISHVVSAVGEAAVEASSAVAHLPGQARIAFLQPDGSATAIFQHQNSGVDTNTSVASPLVSRGRRTSCEYVMGGGSRRPHRGRGSMDSVQMTSLYTTANNAAAAAALGHVTAMVAEGRCTSNSFTDANTANRYTKSRMSFVISSDKGASCKGHTLPLSGTLLSDALSREAAGLCVSDFSSYVQDKRAFPRDAVLSRDGVMPLSLALATVSPGGKPLVALYVTYGTSLPQPLLQAVVEALQQLLQAIVPVIKVKLDGTLRPEWDCLRAQLEDAMKRKGGGAEPGRNTQNGFACVSEPDGGVSANNSTLAGGGRAATAPGMENPQPPTAHGGPDTISFAMNGTATTAAGGGGGGGNPAPAVPGASTLPPGRLSAVNFRVGSEGSEALGASPFSTMAAQTDMAGGGGGAAAAAAAAPPLRRGSLLGPARSEGGPQGGNRRPNSALRRLLGMHLPSAVSEPPLTDVGSVGVGSVGGGSVGGGGGGGDTGVGSLRQHSWLQCSDSDSSPHVMSVQQPDCRSLPPAHERLLGAVRSVSFKLEAARSPRGASRLAPIITIMHERLKAAQAAQMTGGRTEARKADLQSVKLMQEVGKGGYGTVYRGTYHGSEVAVKVIQEKELAAMQTSNGDALQHSASVMLHKQNLHDAIELVASVSVSHPNIVQVLTFFTDCKLQLGAETSVLFDSMDIADPSNVAGGARLVHMPSLLESPAPGTELGGVSVALVMEYMDAGSLSDAIQKRIFFERLEVANPTGGRTAKGLLAVSMRSVYATLLEVALALRHMHALHLVHCDLKPQNVLLKSAPRDPRGFTAKLSDFGLAKTMAHDEDGQLVIDEAVASGTITHIAPEVFMGKKSLGAAVDIYAFGIIMFQVLCGMRLYEGMSAQEIANAVAHRMLRPTLPQWVPPNYRALAERCWHQLPSARPTADELVRQLEKLSDFRRRNVRAQSGSQQ